MKKLILISLCSIFGFSISNAQSTVCECLDLSIEMMKETQEKGLESIKEIEEKYGTRFEKCDKLFLNMDPNKMMTDMAACPRYNEMMELTMKMMEEYPELMEME